MGRIQITAGSHGEVEQVIDFLREADRMELQIASNMEPRAAVLESWRVSNYRRIFLCSGEPIVVYGVAPSQHVEHEGVPWMVATDAINMVSKEFLLSCRTEIDRMRAGYTELRNATHKDNTLSLRWLAWLGFRISDVPVGPGGAMRLFSMPGLPDLPKE